MLLEAQQFSAMLKAECLERNDIGLNYENDKRIAKIPIHGLLTKRPELFSPLLDTVSYEEIQDAILRAQQDSEVSMILLDIDSPGGEVSGLFDIVDFIYESRKCKPIYSIANDQAFSAAYAIASATSKIFITRTGGVGSIGVIATHMDVSEADKKEVVKFTTVFAGSKKNELSPHEPLSDEAARDLQSEVNRLYEIFVDTVARNRGMSAEQIKATQAATYFAENAVAIGLADEIASNGELFRTILGGNMNEEMERYKTEIIEITKLCKLAHAEGQIMKFIEEGLSADQVKSALLETQSQRDEIVSSIYQKEAVKEENPVIAAAKARASKGE